MPACGQVTPGEPAAERKGERGGRAPGAGRPRCRPPPRHRQRLQLPAEPPVADDDEAGLGDDASDKRGGAQEYVGAFLRGEPPGEADDRGPLAVWLGDVRPERQSGDRGQHLDAGGRHAVSIDEHVAYGGRRSDDAAGPAGETAAPRPRPPPPPPPPPVPRPGPRGGGPGRLTRGPRR